MMNEHQALLNALHFEMLKLQAGDPQLNQHFCKVHAYAKLIGETEGLDEETLFRLEAGALAHDIGILKSRELYGNADGPNQEKEGPPIARAMLSELGFDAETVDRVCFLIAHHHTYSDIQGADYQILIEADFIVNLFEGRKDSGTVQEAYERIFRTETGKRIMRDMFGFA